MNKTILLLVGLLLVAGAVWAEVYVFQFRTYFQETVVQETLPPMPTTQAQGTQQVQATPLVVAQGSFGKVDVVHKGSGTARIVEQGGKRYLQLENFQVTNGPDLYIYISDSKTPGGTLESLGNYSNLARLKASSGNQVYEIPELVRGYDTAVIWCQKFGVLFSYAVME